MIKLSFIVIFLYSTFVFSQDQNQYPDIIIDSYNSTTKTPDIFYGGYKNQRPYVIVPLDSLFYKNDYFVSLPQGSYIVLGFTDNYIIDAPNQNDIFIKEVGGAGEFADIFVSSDNVKYTFLGVAGYGEVNEFDLAKIRYLEPVKYIKIIGKDNKGASPGFDVGSVYGLPGASIIKKEEAFVLENVLFETNKSILLKPSFISLDKLVQQLQVNKSINIEITGHTDTVGSKSKNQKLSEERAKALLDYLVSKGIDADRLSYKGLGDSEPIESNDTQEGRTKNRRVEFFRMK